jgi:hypothetical protein
MPKYSRYNKYGNQYQAENPDIEAIYFAAVELINHQLQQPRIEKVRERYKC